MNIDALMQDCSISNGNTLEIPQSHYAINIQLTYTWGFFWIDILEADSILPSKNIEYAPFIIWHFYSLIWHDAMGNMLTGTHVTKGLWAQNQNLVKCLLLLPKI